MFIASCAEQTHRHEVLRLLGADHKDSQRRSEGRWCVEPRTRPGEPEDLEAPESRTCRVYWFRDFRVRSGHGFGMVAEIESCAALELCKRRPSPVPRTEGPNQDVPAFRGSLATEARPSTPRSACGHSTMTW